ncbi:subtilisin-like protease 3 [Salvia hispanica]|uniref:subtilisin-like protease 3 n=1 Tax=Salvia hispanica TaxID=49212 RepID=UPI002009431B|nr:subtilisin-like protease 3 [Salvia hispanica]
MENTEGFVSVRREKVYELHTTHTPNFLGLNQNAGFWKSSNYGKGVIIGILDSGITPGHPSFSDEGVPPPPAKWKGRCDFNSSGCNNKLIGARSFLAESPSPVDEQGHGTHTSSTAGGNFVRGAGVYGSANGTSSGVAPLAHVAMYRVCGVQGCPESALLAGIDAAIGDGVDIMSMSLGVASVPFYSDSVALGAFRAVEKGVFVSCSAGNRGPSSGSVSNAAPWVLTVGASTVDRRLAATVVLGDGQKLSGEAMFQPRNFSSAHLALVFPGARDNTSSKCSPGTLDKAEVAGKIVMCERSGSIAAPAESMKIAGGAAMILVNGESAGYSLNLVANQILPMLQLSFKDACKIKTYLNNTSTPTAKIVFQGTQIGDPHAPYVASFSSRGPNRQSRGILKPDIIGPGSNILAAWIGDNKGQFNIISGTSMACPHVSGVAALLKSAHPDWSPAAVRSAIMTTAYRINLSGKPIEDHNLLAADPYSIGSGHVNPIKANNPDLVYDLQPENYIPYLCGLNYTDQQVGIIVQRRVNCLSVTPIADAELNYPSFSINLGSSAKSVTYTRTVTNVGGANSSYHVKIAAPRKVKVSVEPAQLKFSKVGQKLSYKVSFTRLSIPAVETVSQGLLSWISADHLVASPIAVTYEHH